MAVTLQAVVALNTTSFTGGIAGLQASVSKFAGVAMTAFGGVAGEVSAMWGAFGPMGGVISGLKQVVAIGTTYEQSMARVSSYSGIAGKDLEQLGERGREAAEKLGFSGEQTGNAMADLALSGIDTADAMMNVLVPALKLAGATGGTTTQTSETLTAALKVFRFETSEATNVANLFAGAIASSPLNMDRLADSMKYAGPAASAFGMSLKQTVDVIAAFHQVGLRGEQAGTSFRMALMKLSEAAASGAGQVGAAMQGWKSSTEGLVGAVKRLEDAGVPASNIILELGARAGPGMAALLKLGSTAMDDLSAKVTKNSEVSKMYDTQMNTLAGHFKLFKASVEEAAQKLFILLGPAFEKILGMAKSLLGSIVKLAESFSFVGKAAGELLPVLVGAGGLLWAFGKILAICPLLGGSLTGLFAGAAASMAPTAAALTSMGTKTIPLVAAASLGLSKHTTTLMNGYQALNPALYKSVHSYDLMHGAVTRHNAVTFQAATATNGFLGTLTKLQAGVLMAAAAFAGWKLGQWIGQMNVGGKTIEGWTQHLIQLAMGLGDVDAQNQSVIDSVKRVVEQQKIAAQETERLAKAEAQAFAAREAAFKAQGRAEDKAREAMMAKIKADSEAAKASEILATTVLDVAFAMEYMESATGATSESQAALLAASAGLSEAEKNLMSAIEAKTKAQKDEQAALDKVNEAQRAAIDAKRLLAKANQDAADAVDQYGVGETEAAEATSRATEANSANEIAVTNLRNAVADLNTAQNAVAESSDAVAAAQKGVADAVRTSAVATDESIAGFNSMRVLTKEYAISFDDAKSAAGEFGDKSVEVAARAKRLGATFADAADDERWFSKNLVSATDILKLEFSDVVSDASEFLQQFGRRSIEVAQYMREHNVAAEEAGKALHIYGAGLNDAGKDIEPAIDSMARLGKETIAFGKSLTAINDDKLTDIYTALKNFALKMGDKAFKDLDLKWIKDLSAIKLPNLDIYRVGIFSGALLALADGIKAATAGGVPDMGWIKDISAFILPRLNLFDVRKFTGALLELVTGIVTAGIPDVSWIKDLAKISGLDTVKLKTIVDILSGLKAGTYNASVLIGWKDNTTLSSIDSSLSKIAEMKGVIWA